MRHTHNITANETHSPAPFVGCIRNYQRRGARFTSVLPSLLGVMAFALIALTVIGILAP